MSKSPEQVRDHSRNSVLSVSTQHELLAVKRRRTTLTVLSTTEMPVSLDEIAEAVTCRETSDGDQVEHARDVKVTLHHIHLPKLDSAGVVDYDAESGCVDSYRPFQ